MLAHLIVVGIGFGLLWFVQHTVQGRAKLIASLVIIGLTLGGLVVDAPKDCPVSADAR